jgi:PleD family two-component response regulator/EAL domain-containing protein (putative c-di-GMP-specific phosphodiesterase class I)
MTLSSTTTPADAGSGEQDLRGRARAFLKAWRAGLRHWQPARALELYDELEQIAAHAEALDAGAISRSALELAVNLGSFTDTDTAPDVAQRENLERLLQRLAASVGESRARADADVDRGHRRQAFVLAPDGRGAPRFAEQLGQRGWLVRPFRETGPLLVALTQVSPDLLAVDEAFADRTHSLVAAMQRRRHPHSDPAVCVILAAETDSERTQFALRAGADAVLAENDPVVLAGMVETLLAQRRSLEYRVLIVEDDRPQAKWFQSILHLRGIATLACDDPAQVLEHVAEFNPDLVLMDLHLPGANGIEIARRIRAQAANAFLPIVFLSAESNVDTRFEAIRAGADDFLTKPVKPGHLLASVESRIKRARELRAGRRENRGERRGIFASREVMAREILRASHDADARAFAVALIAVDDSDGVLRRIGFVNAGILPQQLAAAISAELTGSPLLCAWGELHFLVLLHAPDARELRARLEAARARLDKRTWLSSETPLQLRFSLACARVPAGLARIEELLERVRDACRGAQQAGGARCEFEREEPAAMAPDGDPRQRLLRALLQTPEFGAVVRLSFQPLLPVTGLIAGIYEVRAALQPPNATRIAELSRAEYLDVAAPLDLAASIERKVLAALLDRAHERYATHRELQLQLPLDAATVLDGSFAPWLAAELRAHNISSGTLALQLAAADVAVNVARLRKALPELQRAGVRLALDGRSEEPAAVAPLLDIEDFAFVKFAPVLDEASAQAKWDAWGPTIAKARSLGKIVIACDVPSLNDLAVLVRRGVHYVQGDALASWMDDWNFDFPEAMS